jgi:hypothetical protein
MDIFILGAVIGATLAIVGDYFAKKYLATVEAKVRANQAKIAADVEALEQRCIGVAKHGLKVLVLSDAELKTWIHAQETNPHKWEDLFRQQAEKLKQSAEDEIAKIV